MKLLAFEESLQSSDYEFGQAMISCKDNEAYKMSAGMEYYDFTDDEVIARAFFLSSKKAHGLS